MGLVKKKVVYNFEHQMLLIVFDDGFLGSAMR